MNRQKMEWNTCETPFILACIGITTGGACPLNLVLIHLPHRINDKRRWLLENWNLQTKSFWIWVTLRWMWSPVHLRSLSSLKLLFATSLLLFLEKSFPFFFHSLDLRFFSRKSTNYELKNFKSSNNICSEIEKHIWK